MSPATVLALIGFLDDLFQLGGKLISAAIEKKPELKIEPLPTLDDMDKAREDALKRINLKD